MPRSAAEGFPRHYPPAIVSSLVETTGLGFAVMSGSSHGIAPMQGKQNSPDKEFRSAVPRIAAGAGPYLYLMRLHEVAGVWPLRIPDTATAVSGSSSEISLLSEPDPPL